MVPVDRHLFSYPTKNLTSQICGPDFKAIDMHIGMEYLGEYPQPNYNVNRGTAAYQDSQQQLMDQQHFYIYYTKKLQYKIKCGQKFNQRCVREYLLPRTGESSTPGQSRDSGPSTGSFVPNSQEDYHPSEPLNQSTTTYQHQGPTNDPWF
ncbi:uncharacterized protein LOC113271634 [Papaver somniferum]|uniref:uncharacterized protein LOC113271634 n=1 Tax=Papaver somniferum TaxID=3469 RepID=UPI000E705E94|nr:uncharacterized protein LOC113271634 [Papaver somniferum]